TPKLRENLAAHKEVMPLTRRLVTLDRDAPIEFDLSDCVTPTPNRRALRPIFEELGFRTFLEQIDVAGPAAVAESAEETPSDVESAGLETDYRVVNTDEAFEAFVEELAAQDSFALDTETTALSAVDADLVGYVFSWRAGTGWYVPVRGEHGETLDPEMVASKLKPILENEKTLKIGQNLKYDIVALQRAGIDLAGPLFDTMVAAALLYPGRRTYGMDDLARDLLGVTTTPISDLIGKGKDQLSMIQVPIDQVARYAAEDADSTWRLYERLAKGIDAEPIDAADAASRSRAAGTAASLKQLFTEVEMPLVRVLSDMEREGVSLDAELLKNYAGTIKERLDELRAKMVAVVGDEFNPDSPKQLSEILVDRLGMRVVKTTKTGRSTDAEVLETLAAETDHPLLPLLLEYRELNKLLGTYLLPLPGYLSPVTGRLHASFHQTGAATGRLSSSDPNIQNIPIRTQAGREIRRACRARDEDTVLITADYSQVELRMLAHFSDDTELVKAFREGQDIHAFVASQVFGVPIEEVTPDQRRIAKTVNFGIVYGQTAFGLSRTLRIPRAESQRFIDEYKERYAGLD